MLTSTDGWGATNIVMGDVVTINLYFVKKRTPLRRFAPQHGALFVRAAGDSVPRPLTTFTLRESTFNGKINLNPNPNKIWRASLRVSTGRIWGSWPYSQPRTGVVNRLPGIVSDRTPLAHFAEVSGANVIHVAY
jgi:hypothetical protein